MTGRSFDYYQQEAGKTAVYPNDKALEYLVPGLAGEAGELASVWAKSVRKDAPLNEDHLLSEAGDVLWFLAMICDELGVSLESIADNNLEKLRGRMERGTIQGSGENR